MISNKWAYLYWTTNLEELFGFRPGELIIYGYQAGGGFAGTPEQLHVGLVSGIAPNQPKPEMKEWPLPSCSVQYVVGGFKFNGYHYKQKKDDENGEGERVQKRD